MNPFTSIHSILKKFFPVARIVVTRPKLEDGVWSLDIDLDENSIVVEWDQSVGFGISTVRTESYGERPDETYQDETATLARLLMLLGLNQRTSPQTPINLSELRERRDCTQISLAKKLKIRQPTLSAIEHREDVQIGTIRDFVAALGGRLEMLAVFDDVCYLIDTKLTRRRSKALAVPLAKQWFSFLSLDSIGDEVHVEASEFATTLNFSIPL
jgi:transcriptional regulator with XRE-family HTH domain